MRRSGETLSEVLYTLFLLFMLGLVVASVYVSFHFVVKYW